MRPLVRHPCYVLIARLFFLVSILGFETDVDHFPFNISVFIFSLWRLEGNPLPSVEHFRLSYPCRKVRKTRTDVYRSVKFMKHKVEFLYCVIRRNRMMKIIEPRSQKMKMNTCLRTIHFLTGCHLCCVKLRGRVVLKFIVRYYSPRWIWISKTERLFQSISSKLRQLNAVRNSHWNRN